MSRLSTNMHPLLTDIVVDTLHSKNIFTVWNFIETDTKQLSVITNLPYKNILSIRRHLINKNSAVTRNGLEYFKELVKKSAIIPTGIKNIDNILDGGLSTGNIYEICGLPASGKTQFCLTLVKNIVQTLNQVVYYLDTKRDFNAKRIKQMLDVNNTNEAQIGEVLAKILVKQINTEYELVNALHEIKNNIKDGLNVKLIILDSLPPVLYQLSDVTKRYGILNHVVNVMRFLCVEYYTCIVVTNDLITWSEGSFGEEQLVSEKIGCGKYWLSVPHVRFKLTKSESNEECEIFVLKSCKPIRVEKCSVKINKEGVV